MAGTAKGKRISSPPGRTVRPTSSTVKEALFDILAPRLPGAVMCDLYAGTGNIGIEALSRGAQKVIFVERSPFSLTLLWRNLHRCGFVARAEVHRSDALRYLKRTQKKPSPCDIVFVDPPYSSPHLHDSVSLVAQDGILKKGGLVAVEHFHKHAFSLLPEGLVLIKNYTYGQTVLSLFRYEGKQS